MPRIDPQQLLRTLSVLLAPTGGIKSSEEVSRIVSLMSKYSKKLVSKCIYVQLLKATPPDLLEQFLNDNGWDLLNVWFSETIKLENWAFCQEMMTLFLLCPVSAGLLKNNIEVNHAPRLINVLRQNMSQGDTIRSLATQVYEKWLTVVTPVKSVEDDKDSGILLLQSMADELSQSIKKEAPKPEKRCSGIKDIRFTKAEMPVRERKTEARNGDDSKERSSKPSDAGKRRRDERDSKKDVDKDRKRFRPDHRDEVKPEERQRIKEKARKLKEEAEKEKEKDTLGKLSATSAGLPKIPKIPKKPVMDDKKKSLSFEEMLGGLDSAKPKTVKTPLNKNKTASLLEGLTKPSAPSSKSHHSSSSSKHEDRSKSSSSSSSAQRRDSGHRERESDREREARKKEAAKKDSTAHSKGDSSRRPAALVLPERKRSIDTPESATKASKSSPHMVAESSGFMDALFSSMNKDEPRKKKRRSSESESSKKAESSNNKQTSTSKTESAEDSAQPLSFYYRDTMAAQEDDEDGDGDEGAGGKEEVRAHSNGNKHEAASSNGVKAGSNGPAVESESPKEESLPFEEPPEMPREVKGILVYHRGSEKRSRSIKWRPDKELTSVHYFEMDEDERVNVNKIKFENMRQMELNLEKAALKSKNVMGEDQAVNQWRSPRPFPFAADKVHFVAGAESEQKEAQSVRERSVLLAIYFSRDTTPATPAEPDPEDVPRTTEVMIVPVNSPSNDTDVCDYRGVGWAEPKANSVDQFTDQASSFSLPPSLVELLNTMGGGLPKAGPSGSLSHEDSATLAAQTQAMKELGMLPGVNFTPSFPPPSSVPPPGLIPAGPPPTAMGVAPTAPPPDFSQLPHLGGHLGPPRPLHPPPNGMFGGPPPQEFGFHRGGPRGFPPPRGFGGGRGMHRFPHEAGGFRGGAGGYKTKRCIFFANGNCKNGERCQFIHDQS